ncbi:MAG TPA: rhomboid family intramembrane serine protease [Rhodocyclaceae bacterium]
MTATPEAATLIERLRARRRLVPATYALVAANVLLFLAMMALGAGLRHSPNDLHLAWGASFGPATQDGQWWRLGSAMFLHFGILHLAFNMWALWDAGQFVERMFGTPRFVLLYAGAGLSGNLLSLALQGNRAVSGGASGAIFGLFGALLIVLWRERRQLRAREFRWLFGGAGVFAAASIVFGTFVPGIDNAAHLGGLAAGTLLAVVLYRPDHPDAAAAWHVRLAATVILGAALAALVAALPAPRYRWTEELQAREEIRQFLQQESLISSEWNGMLGMGQRGELSFEQLASRLDRDIAPRYADSFAELSRLPEDAAIPSAGTLRLLREYAQVRSEQTRALAQGIREGDAESIAKARELDRRAVRLRGMLKTPTH